MMEKRNFTTSSRVVDACGFGDELVDSAASLFGGKSEKFEKKASEGSRFEKKACIEDEKADSNG